MNSIIILISFLKYYRFSKEMYDFCEAVLFCAAFLKIFPGELDKKLKRSRKLLKLFPQKKIKFSAAF